MLYYTVLSAVHDILVGWLCFTSHRQRGHLETAPPFTVPCEGHKALFLHRSHRESNLWQSRDSPLHYRCATPAPHDILKTGRYGCTIPIKILPMGDPKSDRWRYLVFQFYYPYIRAVSFSQTALKMIRHRQ